MNTPPRAEPIITLTKYDDPGHGWLAVKRKLLPDEVLAKISHYSYQSKSGGTVYLEEDCDATIALVHLRTVYLVNIQFRYTDFNSRIRSYPGFVHPLPQHCDKPVITYPRPRKHGAPLKTLVTIPYSSSCWMAVLAAFEHAVNTPGVIPKAWVKPAERSLRWAASAYIPADTKVVFTLRDVETLRMATESLLGMPDRHQYHAGLRLLQLNIRAAINTIPT